MNKEQLMGLSMPVLSHIFSVGGRQLALSWSLLHRNGTRNPIVGTHAAMRREDIVGTLAQHWPWIVKVQEQSKMQQ
jgi:hypothetical protein